MRKTRNYNLWLDLILVGIPFFIMVVYGGLTATGWLKDFHVSPNFNLSLFGYNFNLVKAAHNWYENAEHGFFLVTIPLVIIQLIAMLLGLIVDLFVHFIFLILNILWFVLIIIFWALIAIILPAGLPIWLIVNFILIKKDDIHRVIYCGVAMVLSLIFGVAYFIVHLG